MWGNIIISACESKSILSKLKFDHNSRNPHNNDSDHVQKSGWWFNTYLFAKSNWKQIESISISISKSWKGWTHVAYYYKHSKSLGDIFCGCDMIPLHKRRSGVNFLNQMMTCRFSSQLRKKELILPIGL